MDWEFPRWLNPANWFRDDAPAGPISVPEAPAATPATPGTLAEPAQQPTPGGTAPVMSHWAEDDRPKGHPETVVYLGINDSSREKEKEAFKDNPNATIVTGAGTDKSMQGKVMAADGKTKLDLGNEGDLQRYLSETGISGVRKDKDGKPMETPEEAEARMASLTNLFLGEKNKDGAREGGLNAGVRDEMAGFLKVLQNVEQGDGHMDRLVMSGHSTGDWVYSEAPDNPGVTFEQMKTLMGQFPKAQGGVQDLMLSACHTLEKSQWGDTRDGKQYKDIFPNLETAWGYNGVSPNWQQGSVQHIRNWLKASDGDDPAAVAAAAKKSGANATAKMYEN